MSFCENEQLIVSVDDVEISKETIRAFIHDAPVVVSALPSPMNVP